MELKNGTLKALFATTSLVVALGATTATAQNTQVNEGADITALCGEAPTRIALVDGYGGDTWRKITEAELRDEASKCPNITEIAYAEAGGDPQQYNSLINGYTAQGYDIILAFTDFGDAALPAYRSAFEAGVTMVPYFGNISGEPGVDYSVNPYQDSIAIGASYAAWFGTSLGGEGNVLMLGGPAGAASSQDFMNGFVEGLKAFPNITLLDENYIVTNWNPADAQKATAGLIAQYPQIDGIASDYGVTALAATKAFLQAGLPVPAMASIASSNEYHCLFQEQTAAGTPWSYLALDGSTADVRFALRQGMAMFQGLTTDEPLGVVPYVYADTVSGVAATCSDTAPPDADLSSLLPEDKLNALFQQ
jgi:ribose transport system substrate-binding protein